MLYLCSIPMPSRVVLLSLSGYLFVLNRCLGVQPASMLFFFSHQGKQIYARENSNTIASIHSGEMDAKFSGSIGDTCQTPQKCWGRYARPRSKDPASHTSGGKLGTKCVTKEEQEGTTPTQPGTHQLDVRKAATTRGKRGRKVRILCWKKNNAREIQQKRKV